MVITNLVDICYLCLFPYASSKFEQIYVQTFIWGQNLFWREASAFKSEILEHLQATNMRQHRFCFGTFHAALTHTPSRNVFKDAQRQDFLSRFPFSHLCIEKSRENAAIVSVFLLWTIKLFFTIWECKLDGIFYESMASFRS